MRASDVARATSAAIEVASSLGLSVADASVLHDSNKLTLRLLPCDVAARVAFAGQEAFQTELELATRLAATGGPVVRPAPGVEPRAFSRDGFVVTLWTYSERLPVQVSSAAYAQALLRLHQGMAKLDIDVPHFTDRVAEAEHLVASRALSPTLADGDRELLGSALRTSRKAVTGRLHAEQLLHGEPHPGNLLNTQSGPLFIDLETCCRGPIEFDLAHVPERVAASYQGGDAGMLRDARLLVLAMVAAWRCDPGDQLPNGRRALAELLRALRNGPPWPTLDVVMGSAAGPPEG